MQLKYLLNLAVILTVIATTSINVEGRRLKLRPLSAREVYGVLKAAGREDAIPEGRVVTQGIAAMTGFALGITKGIGGTLLFNLATSNATSEFINNFNITGLMDNFQGINMTAFTQMFNGGSITNTPGSILSYQTQEICILSRSLEPGEQARNAQYDETDENYDNDENERQAYTPTTSITSTNPTTNPTTPTIKTGRAASQTCIVIQTPTIRNRRSSHRKRH